MDKKIDFDTFVDKLLSRYNNIVSKEDFELWIDENYDIRSYVSISKKYAILNIAKYDVERELQKYMEYGEMHNMYLHYDLCKMYYLLFSYIDISAFPKDLTIDVYDLIMQSGFFDYVMSFCKKDYDKFEKITDRYFGINEYILINSMKDIFGNFPTQEEAQNVADILNGLDIEKLKVLQTVEEYNNPLLKRAINGMARETIKEELKNSTKDIVNKNNSKRKKG